MQGSLHPGLNKRRTSNIQHHERFELRKHSPQNRASRMGMRPYTYELKMDPDSESVLNFAEEFLHLVIAEVDQASDDRLYEIIDVGC